SDAEVRVGGAEVLVELQRLARRALRGRVVVLRDRREREVRVGARELRILLDRLLELLDRGLDVRLAERLQALLVELVRLLELGDLVEELEVLREHLLLLL